jgi:hypothetical protein
MPRARLARAHELRRAAQDVRVQQVRARKVSRAQNRNAYERRAAGGSKKGGPRISPRKLLAAPAATRRRFGSFRG